jgi:hypothetical protein
LSPLHVCNIHPGLRPRLSLRLLVPTLRAAILGGVALSLMSGVPASAQDAAADKNAQPAAPQTSAPPAQQPPPAASAPPAIDFRNRPKYPTDPQRLRRTVQIDGVLTDGEWDPFYTLTDGPVKGTVYCNWDDNFLYLAARTDQPASVLFDVDTGGDGWLRGADNLEIVVGSVPEGGAPLLVARLLDAANSKDTPAWNDKSVDPKAILVAGKVTNGTQVIELAIPKNTASLVLRPGAAIGLRAEFLPPGPPTAYTPTQPFEPHLLLDATLVDSRAQAVAGINPRLSLSDVKCIAGQKLFATLELFNQRDLSVPLRAVTWTGQGNSINAVDTLRTVSVPPIPPMKTLKLKYDTMLPPDLVVGSYTLLVTAETMDGKQVQSAATFTVVEPLQVQMASAPEPVEIVGNTKLQVNVDIYSAVPDHTRGDVELTTLPAGWQVKGGRKRGFYIDREDSRTVTQFELSLPSNTPAGEYPLEAVVTWNGRKWQARNVAHVTRAETPAKPQAK